MNEVRYRVVVNNRHRPEVFLNGEFAHALTLAEQLGGVVLDLLKMEWVWPPSPMAPEGDIRPVLPVLRLLSVA